VKRLAEELAAIGVIAALAAVVTRPLLFRPTMGFTQYDATFTLLQLEHLQGAAMGATPWFQGPLGWPLSHGTAHADWVVGQALLGLPLQGLDPARAGALLAVAGLVATAWAAHLLARALLGPGPHTWLAALVGGMGSSALVHGQHLNLLHHEVMVGAALLLGAGFHRKQPWLALLGGLAAGAATHFGVYIGVHTAAVVLAVVGGAALARVGDRASWLAAGLGAAIGGASTLPVWVGYAAAVDALGATLNLAELAERSWDPATWLSWTDTAWLHDTLRSGSPEPRPAGDAGPGAVVLVLASVGFIWGRRGPRWGWRILLGITAAALLLALGPTPTVAGHSLGVPGPSAALHALPGFESLRAPDRWLAVAQVGLGLLAAAGLVRLLGRRRRWLQVLVTSGVLAAVVAELPSVAARELTANPAPAAWLLVDEVMGDGALDEIFPPSKKRCQCTPLLGTRLALYHQRPILGGRYARTVPTLARIDRLADTWPRTASAEALQAHGVRVVLEHPPFRYGSPDGWTCTQAGDHRVCHHAEPLPDLTPTGATWPPMPRRTRRVADFPSWQRDTHR